MCAKFILDPSGRPGIARLIMEDEDALRKTTSANPLSRAIEQNTLTAKALDKATGVSWLPKVPSLPNFESLSALAGLSAGIGFSASVESGPAALNAVLDAARPSRPTGFEAAIERSDAVMRAIQATVGTAGPLDAFVMAGSHASEDERLKTARDKGVDRLLEDRHGWNELHEQFDREKEEQTNREVQMLQELQAIRRGLETEILERKRLAEAVRQNEEELRRLRKGAPGRPSAMQLVEAEFARRVAEGQLEDTITEQSRVLSEWLTQEHPLAARLTAKTVENKLRTPYRHAKVAAASADRVGPRKTRRPRK